jgi:hypothetical protein
MLKSLKPGMKIIADAVAKSPSKLMPMKKKKKKMLFGKMMEKD